MDIGDLTVISRERRAAELARVLGCVYKEPDISVDTANVLIYGGFYDDLILADNITRYFPDKKIYVLFTGVDVCELQDAILTDRSYYCALLEIFKRVKAITLGNRLEEELCYLGIKAVGSVVLPVEVSGESDGTALTAYIPEEPFRRYLFRVPVLKRLAGKLDGFVTYGAVEPGPWENLGWVDDMAEIYKRTRLNIRLTRHDGQPYDLIAMAQMGIQSVVSYCDFPYMVSVPDTDNDDVVYGMTLNAIKNYEPNEIDEMKTYYRKKYSAENCRRGFERV